MTRDDVNRCLLVIKLTIATQRALGPDSTGENKEPTETEILI
jgi:hypothetical protein